MQVLFVLAHPDDETFATGVAIAEHVAFGHDVHLLWLTQGLGSDVQGSLNGLYTNGWWGVPHIPAAEGYTPLDDAAFGAARIAECTTAVRALTSGLGTITIHPHAGLDGAVTQASAYTAILGVCEQIAPGGAVWLKTHTWVSALDAHPDHIAAGSAGKQLAVDYPARFGAMRYYLLSRYWTSPALSQVTESWDIPSASTAARVVHACRALGAWAPEAGRYAISNHSTPDLIATMMAAPKNMYHT